MLHLLLCLINFCTEKQFLQEYHQKKQEEEKLIEIQLLEFKKTQLQKLTVTPQTHTERIDTKLLKKQELPKELNFKPTVRFKRKDEDIDTNKRSPLPKKVKSESFPSKPLVTYDFESDDE